MCTSLITYHCNDATNRRHAQRFLALCDRVWEIAKASIATLEKEVERLSAMQSLGTTA